MDTLTTGFGEMRGMPMGTIPRPGSPIPPPPPRRQIARDEAGRIAEPISCRACGYNLRGLDPESRCPECHFPIATSIQGDLLRFCDPVWLEKLTSGTLWILVGIIVGVVSGILVGVVAIPIAMSGAGFVSTLAVSSMVALVVAIIKVVGYWKVTALDPGAGDQSSVLSWRVVARYALLAALLSGPAQTMLSNPMVASSMPGAAAPPMVAIALFVILAGLAGLVQLIGTFALGMYAAGISRRIPNRSITTQTRVVTWGYVISTSLSLASGLLIMVMVTIPGPGTAPGAAAGLAIVPFGFGACFGGLGAMVFGIWGIVLLFRYRSQLQRSAFEARQAWAVMMSSPAQQ